MIQAQEVKIVNVFQEVKWYFPKLKHGHIIAVPLNDTPIFFFFFFFFFCKRNNQIPIHLMLGAYYDKTKYKLKPDVVQFRYW